ncbi:MAG: HD domain-containing phosphohydrolase [Myxococcota bacterium]
MTSPPEPTELPAVLFVDDEVNIRRALIRLFRNEPVQVYQAASADQALAILSRVPVEVVISDHRMAHRTGVELLSEVRERWPEVVRMLLTGYTDMEVAIEAINHGEIYRLITKPWNDDELRATVRGAIDACRMQREIQRLDSLTREQNRELQQMNRELEMRVDARTKEVQDKHSELRLAYVSTVRALAEAIDAKDPYTRGHSERVGVYASRIARQLRCEVTFIERIYLAGLLHDVGKIGVPDAIIRKPGRLTPEEYAQMKRHPEIGARIIEPVSFLADIAPCVRHHHEWFDGSDRGYPDRLSGDRIPFASRVILVADTVEAMTSDRPYRRALPMSRVIDEVRKFTGRQFDPTPADAFLEIVEREGDGFIEKASKFDIEAFLAEAAEGD